MASCWIRPCPGGACIMYLALVFEISYSGRKNQKSVAWIIAAIFLEAVVNFSSAHGGMEISGGRSVKLKTALPLFSGCLHLRCLLLLSVEFHHPVRLPGASSIL